MNIKESIRKKLQRKHRPASKIRRRRDRVVMARKVHLAWAVAAGVQHAVGPAYEMTRVDVIQLNRYRRQHAQRTVMLPKGPEKISQVSR